LVAEFVGRRAHEAGILYRGAVDRHLVGAGDKQIANVLDRAHTAADGQRHETLVGRAPDHIEQDAAILVGRIDVEKAQFVGAGRIIGLGGLDRISGIDEIDKIDALDDAAVLDVEAGNNAGFQHDFGRIGPVRNRGSKW